MDSVTQDLMDTQPKTLSGEAFARNLLLDQLRRSEAVTIIAGTLSSLELQRDGLPLCRLADRDFADFRRLVLKAKAIVRSVGDDVEDGAIEAAAIVMCEGKDQEYSAFETQLSTVRVRYVEWAKTVIRAYWDALEGRAKGDLR